MPLKTHHDEQPALNLTPMIDIVFLLIIFFMVGTEFSNMERDLDVRVPEVDAAENLLPRLERSIVNVYRDGRIVLDQQTVSLDELAVRLNESAAHYREAGIQVRGDAESTHQQIAEVLMACQQAGITNLAVSVLVPSPRFH